MFISTPGRSDELNHLFGFNLLNQRVAADPQLLTVIVINTDES